MSTLNKSPPFIWAYGGIYIMVYIKTKITCREGYSEYSVDTNGIVYSKKTGKPLKPSINHSGYLMVNLMINGK